LVTVSIISHGQIALVENLLPQVRACPEVSQIILTLNTPEFCSLQDDHCLKVIRNSRSKGFSENHNMAFGSCKQPFFCVMNPDITLLGNPFPKLLDIFQDFEVGVVAPLVVSNQGELEDSAREFPSVGSLMRKLIFKDRGIRAFDTKVSHFETDWAAGMFLLIRFNTFENVGGFDEKYYLYYEDVDLCWRIRQANMPVIVCTTVEVVHDARRDSHRRLNYLIWHLSSMLRFLLKSRGSCR
jgi:N-acetylglucosaminyl-diphospho-decaprenol L-rhamnosyltransferase